MAIISKRFATLNGNDDLSISDISSLSDTLIRNNPELQLKALSTELSTFVEGGMCKATTEKEASIDSAVRSTRDLIANVKDSKLLNPAELNKKVLDLFPDNPLARSVFTQLSDKCKTPALNNHSLGKPYNPTISCNGKPAVASNGACNAGSYGDILNKLTGGGYNAAYKDLNLLLNKVMALGSFGYKMNMCGVFNAVTADMGDKSMLSRASAGLLGMLSKSGNSVGALDVIGGSAGLSPLRELPAAVSMTLSSFSIPDGIKESGLSEMSDRMMGGAELLDESWNKTNDDMLSIADFGSYNEDLASVMNASRKDIAIDENSLSFIPNSDHVFLSSVYEGMGNSKFA
jgi:hypothetical protein